MGRIDGAAAAAVQIVAADENHLVQTPDVVAAGTNAGRHEAIAADLLATANEDAVRLIAAADDEVDDDADVAAAAAAAVGSPVGPRKESCLAENPSYFHVRARSSPCQSWTGPSLTNMSGRILPMVSGRCAKRQGGVESKKG